MTDKLGFRKGERKRERERDREGKREREMGVAERQTHRLTEAQRGREMFEQKQKKRENGKRIDINIRWKLEMTERWIYKLES